MLQANEKVPFTIEVVGDFTNTKWWGKFEAKVTLSHRDRLARDRLRREYLGDTTKSDPDPDARATATMFSELHVRLTKSPEWWNASDGGLDLKDFNLIIEVYKGALKVEEDYLTELSKQSEDAKKIIGEKSAELAAPEQK